MNTSRRRGSPTKCYLLPALYIHAEASNFSRRQSEYRRASNANAPLAASQGNQEDVRFNTSPYASQILTVAALSAACFGLYATVTLPPVVATTPRIGGGEVICRGIKCADVLGSMQEALPPYPTQDDSMPAGDVAIDGNAFCQNLNQNKPSGCSLGNPPPSPGITVPGQAAWSANGCGTGGIGSWFQDAILEVATSQSYSGDIHAPYPGVSFRAACDTHDACWASGGGRGQCDLAFWNQTLSACTHLSNTDALNTCNGFANGYHFAVSTTNGSHSAYATSTANRQCALWGSDMRENGCVN